MSLVVDFPKFRHLNEFSKSLNKWESNEMFDRSSRNKEILFTESRVDVFFSWSWQQTIGRLFFLSKLKWRGTLCNRVDIYVHRRFFVHLTNVLGTVKACDALPFLGNDYTVKERANLAWTRLRGNVSFRDCSFTFCPSSTQKTQSALPPSRD